MLFDCLKYIKLIKICLFNLELNCFKYVIFVTIAVIILYYKRSNNNNIFHKKLINTFVEILHNTILLFFDIVLIGGG